MISSFRNIFRQGDVSHIEIPIIQRDYAQGRNDVGVKRIRRAFLQVLHDSLTSGKAVGLDFVYGEVQNGRMIPLDGQQRLTTLFLLHWYLAARSGIAGEDCSFLGKFTYKTRFSARHFCEKLIAQRPPFPASSVEWQPNRHWLPEWLTNQHWYADAWKHDPTIQAMLVTLDDIHDLFATTATTGCRAAWDRLVSEVDPVITFDYLSLEDMGLSDELYIKMNSRGKPLTPFEHFKADFEKTLGEVSEESRKEFIRKVDQDWSDLLWPLRNSNIKQGNDDSIIDDEFLRLFHFIGDVVVSRYGLSEEIPNLFKNDIDAWAERIYGKKNDMDPLATHRYLFLALDSFVSEFGKMKKSSDFSDWFDDYFTDTGHRQGAVAIFGDVDLFGACCADFGSLQGDSRRAFTLSRILLFFAVLEYLMLKPRPLRVDIDQRLRTLRNLVFASNDEIRPKNFPALLYETAEYIGTGDRSGLNTFNDRQITEEELKEKLLSRHSGHPDLQEALHCLEDHGLLRGCLASFDLNMDADTFIRRAELFHQIFSADVNQPYIKIGAALLASGDYSQHPRRDDRFQFGSPDRTRVWLELLTGNDIANTKKALMKMLDDYGNAAGASVEERLQAVVDDYLDRQLKARNLDWRYYLVKYPEMRFGLSGIYVSSKGVMGFDLCMMKEKQFNGAYRDPYLLAVIVQSGAKEGQEVVAHKYFGWNHYKPENRWIELIGTGERIMSCREYGFELRAPSEAAELGMFTTIRKKHNVGDDLMLRVPQVVVDGVTYDQEDRIEAASKLLKELIAGQLPTLVITDLVLGHS
jgi:Protein of unknown function DUF262